MNTVIARSINEITIIYKDFVFPVIGVGVTFSPNST